jgi:hypothetical protein
MGSRFTTKILSFSANFLKGSQTQFPDWMTDILSFGELLMTDITWIRPRSSSSVDPSPLGGELRPIQCPWNSHDRSDLTSRFTPGRRGEGAFGSKNDCNQSNWWRNSRFFGSVLQWLKLHIGLGMEQS